MNSSFAQDPEDAVPPTTPEAVELRFTEELAKLDSEYTSELTKMIPSYLGALLRAEKDAREMADLDLVLAIREEIKWAESLEEPGPRELSEREPLARLQSKWNQAIASAETERKQQHRELSIRVTQYSDGMKNLATTEGEIEQALAWRDLSQKIRIQTPEAPPDLTQPVLTDVLQLEPQKINADHKRNYYASSRDMKLSEHRLLKGIDASKVIKDQPWIFLHPTEDDTASVFYTLKPGTSDFRATLHIPPAKGTVEFMVVQDETVLFRRTAKGQEQPVQIRIPLKAGKVLELRAGTAGDFSASWAMWLSPVLVERP